MFILFEDEYDYMYALLRWELKRGQVGVGG